ncbi:YadA-like family protein [Caballeronia telluris]|nr:YadA-like family protein [Caballeronia telluris]
MATIAGAGSMFVSHGAYAASQALFNDGTSNACTSINADGTTSAVTGTAACATALGAGTAAAAGLGSGLNFISDAHGAFVNGGLEVFGTGVTAGSPAAYIHGGLSLFSGPGTTGAANKIVGVAAGTLGVGSTDAVNGDQLNTTNTNVAGLTTTLNGITSGGGIKYFRTNSSLADASATGTDAVAIGGGAQASTADALAMGNSAVANGTNAIALGGRSTSTAGASIAIGEQASALGSGAGAIAIGSAGGSYAAATAVGNSSIAIGSGAATVGNSSAYQNVAIGPGAIAGNPITNGYNNTALGANANAVWAGTTAIGNGATASSWYTTALGGGATATAYGSIAVSGSWPGSNPTVASGSNSVAIGNNANSSASTSVALGYYATSSGSSAAAIGPYATASAGNSVALGNKSTTTADLTQAGYNPGSTALSGVASTANGEVSVGLANKERRITNVAPGYAATDAVNVSQLKSEDAKVNQEGATTASALGGGASYNATTGAISNPSYAVGSNTYNNVGSALADLAGQAASAVKYDSASKDTITLAGTSGTTLTNLKAGSIAAGSTDAVTGDQLNTTNANVGANTTAIAGLDTRVTQNTTDIDSLNTTVASNTADLTSAQSQLSALDAAAVKYDGASKDTITLAGTSGTTLTNLKAGSIAAGSTDAVTGDQLNTTNTNVTANTTAIAGLDTRVTTNTTDITSAQSQLSALDAAAVKYDSASKDTITLAGTSGTTITNLKAGSIAAGSTDAVTGDQLNTTNTNVTANTTAIAGLDTRVTQNTTDIDSLNTTVASNTADLTSAQSQLSALDAAAVKYDSASKDTITLAGTAGTTITNLKAGSIAAGSTDAVTGDQLNTTNSNVTANTTAIAGLDTRVSALDAAAVKYDSASKDTITLAGTSGTTLTNLKAGSIAAGSTDAVTGDQLNTTNANVTSNTTAIAGLDTRVTTNTTDIASAQSQLSALDAAAVKYDSASKDTITLAGTAGTIISNVKAGVADTDAANVGQLKASGLVDANGNPLSGVTYDTSAKDTITPAGTAGTTLTNLKAGSIAAGSTDAVTGDQLNTTNTNVTANTTDIAGLDTRVTTNTTDIASAQSQLSALDAAAVKYDSASKDTITLAGTSGTTLTNLKAGLIAAGSTDAVTGDQLNTTNTNVTANTTAIAGLDTRVTTNTTDIASAQSQLSALDAAAVKYDNASKSTITLAGTSGTIISNVKAGVADTDAANVGQLKASGLVDASGNALPVVTYDASSNHSTVTFAGATGTQLKNIAAGTDNTDAVNLAQLKATGVVDANGNALDALTYDAGSSKDAITLKGTNGTLITNVKAGRLAADSTDAVNGAQLYALAGNTSDAYVANNGSGVTYSRTNDSGLPPDDAHAQGIGSTAVGYSATASANDALALGRGAQANFANSVALGAGSATTVGAQVNYAAFGLAAPQSSAGEVNVGNRQITGVAAGSADQDAVNVAQLKSVSSKVDGLSATVAQADNNAIKYDDASQGKVTLGGTDASHAPVTIANVGDGTISADSTEAVNGSQLYNLQSQIESTVANAAQAGDIVAAAGATAGEAAQASGTHAVAVGANASASGDNSVALGAHATASASNSTAIGSGATASHDNAVAIGANSTTDRPNSVSVGAVGNERQITNVAAGTQPTDAVNFAQMQGAVAGGVATADAYTDSRINAVQRDSYAGTAAAMAIAGLPQATLPGRGMMAVAGSSYHGQSAVALGVSALSESGRVAIKVTGSTTAHGDYGVSAGAGYHW